MQLIILLLLLCSVISHSFFHISKPQNIKKPIHLFNKKIDAKPKTIIEKTVIPGNYNVASGFILTSLGIGLGLHNIFLAAPIGLIGGLLFVQTGRVRFVFDNDSEYFILRNYFSS